MEKWKRFGISLLYLVAYFICSFIAGALVMVILLSMFFTSSPGTPFDMIEQLTVLSIIPSMLITALLVIGGILLTQKLRHLSFKELGFRKFKLAEALITVVMAIGMMGVVSGFTGIFDSFFSQLIPVEIAESLNNIIIVGGPIVGILIIGIIGPLEEEILMRGVIFHELKKAFSFWPSAIISALLFGIIHLNILQCMVGFCLGIILAYLVYKTKSIWISVIFHVVYNSTIVILGYVMGEIVSMTMNYLFLGVGLPIFIISLIVFVMRKRKEVQNEFA